MIPIRPLSFCLPLCAMLLATVAPGRAVATAEPTAAALTFSGDLRLRYERDWDSQNAAGVARPDRNRGRYRARAAIGYKLSDEWSLGVRARTGSRFSQQSTHLTFAASDGNTDDFEVTLDRYFLQFKQGGYAAWAGRNSTPFWQQNEMYWDEDVTPTGVAGSYETKWENGKLTTTGGAFYLPDGAQKLNGTMVGGQLKYSRPLPGSQFTLAAGLYRLNGKAGAENLRNRNGARDYLIGVISTQWITPLSDGRPLTLGVDLISNFENYGAAEAAPFASSQAGETSGYVFSVLLGQLKQPGDWQVGYFYAHIETLAVNASYAQDDWARFGSGTQSDVSDIMGHEFRLTYTISKTVNLGLRLFLVEAITSIQDAKRCRLDLNWKF